MNASTDSGQKGNRRQRRSMRRRWDSTPPVPVRCVDGPMAGQSGKLSNPPKVLELKGEDDAGDEALHRYRRKDTRTGVEYRFVETADSK